MRKRDPPWLEAVSVTPELIYRYQMAVRRVEDILEEDLNSLKQIHQVRTVTKFVTEVISIHQLIQIVNCLKACVIYLEPNFFLLFYPI